MVLVRGSAVYQIQRYNNRSNIVVQKDHGDAVVVFDVSIQL